VPLRHDHRKLGADFVKEKLGRAHQMRFGAYSLYAAKIDNNLVAELNQ
jgi:selenium-binding protein 1